MIRVTFLNTPRVHDSDPNIYKGVILILYMKGDDFFEYCSISAGKSTIKKIKTKFTIINNYFKGDLTDLKLKDLHGFLAWLNKSSYAKATKNDIIKILKRFLKWRYSDWSKRFDNLKDAKMSGNAHRQLSKEDLLTPEEMKIIVNSIDSLKYKTLLLFFQETACRPEEVLKLKWKEVNLEKGEVKLHSNKTDKTRFIPIKHTLDHLRRYKEECFPTIPKAEDKVFDMNEQSVVDFLRNLEKKLNFSKHLYPYLWRHSVLSRMIKVLSPKVYEMFSGHALETGMEIYAHLDNEDLREELFEKVYKIKPITPEERIKYEELKKEVEEIKKMFSPKVQILLKQLNELQKTKNLKPVILPKIPSR